MSLSVAHLKRLRSLQTSKGRREHGCFLIEGEKLVREALSVRRRTGLAALGTTWSDAGSGGGSSEAGSLQDGSGQTGVVELLGLESQVSELARLGSEAGLPAEVATPTPITAKDAERLSDTRTPQGCFAVMRDRVPASGVAIAELLGGLAGESPTAGRTTTVLALDGVQDPGNAGALIRVAAAFGVDLVLAGPGTADPVQPKVVRTATGAWFRVPMARSADLAADLSGLAQAGFAVLGASPAGESVWVAKAPLRRVLVLGSEGGGFSPAVDAIIGEQVGVPIAAGVESLNVAVAAGVVLGAWSQKISTPGGQGEPKTDPAGSGGATS